MNLAEAIKRGRPFRAPDFVPGWYWWVDAGRLVCGEYPEMSRTVCLGDDADEELTLVERLTAVDYEIMEPAVTITPTQFWAAADEALPNIPENSLNQVSRDNFKRLARCLGLEDAE